MSLTQTQYTAKPVTTVNDVCSFWNTEACGSHIVDARPGTAEFYERFRQLRYSREWHIPLLVPFSETQDKRVLEIGCGNGADGVRFAQAGAQYTGVDLTDAAVEATRRHFEVLGLEGTFRIENAEQLSFPDESFDFVYSHGVLHHTPRPATAFAEVHRVLKRSGKAVLMLYHKHSFNYYVRIMTYMRVRVLARILNRLGHFGEDRLRLTNELKGVRGNQDASIWRLHYENFLRTGWHYLRANNFVHRATDGPECPFAYVYTRAAIFREFRDFSSIEAKVAHLPLRKYRFFQWVPFRVERWLGSKMGWYLFLYLTK